MKLIIKFFTTDFDHAQVVTLRLKEARHEKI